MKKSCLTKIVGVGLLGVFCLPGVVQAQTWEAAEKGAVKIYKEFGGTVKYSEKIGTAVPGKTGTNFKMSQELNKAISQASRPANIGAEVSKANIPNKIIVEGAKEFQAPGNTLKSLDQVKNTANPAQKPAQGFPATQKITDMGTVGEYYSLHNKPTPQPFTGEMSQKIATFAARMGRYYQNKLEWEIWNFKETATKGMSLFENFPQTLTEQQWFLDAFLAKQTEEVKLLFRASPFDTTTKAQIAWIAGAGELDYKTASVEEIENLFNKASEKVTHYQNLLAESYDVDPRAEVALEFVAGDYRLSLTQLEDLIRTVDLRTERIEHFTESGLDVLLREAAQEVTIDANLRKAIAAQALKNWEKANNYTKVQVFQVFNSHQIAVLSEVIDRAHLDFVQSEKLFTYAANAIKRWDRSGSSIYTLFKMMEDGALRGTPLYGEDALEIAQSVFKAW